MNADTPPDPTVTPSDRSQIIAAMADDRLRFDGFAASATREDILDRVVAAFDSGRLHSILYDRAIEVAADVFAAAAPLLYLRRGESIIHGRYRLWIGAEGILDIGPVADPNPSVDDWYANLWNPPSRPDAP